MCQRWINRLIPLSAAILLLSSCSKKISTDTPLTTSYSPSIIVTNDNQMVYAFNPVTGAKNWEFSLPDFVGPQKEFSPSPLLYNNSLYIATAFSDTVYKLNPRTGKLIKKLFMVQTPPVTFNMQATPIANGKMLYLATSNNMIYAVDTGTGAMIWQFATSGPLVSSPVIFSGSIFAATTTGHVYNLKLTGPDPSTGLPAWDFSSPTASFVSSPAISSPYLFIGSITDSSMYCIHTLTGYLRWTYKTQGAIYSSPDASTGKCIFGSTDYRIYCLDTSISPNAIPPKNTPTPIWRDSTNSEVFSSPFVSNQVVYVGGYDYKLYALNIINGKPKWPAFASYGLIKSSPIVYNGTIYVGSYDKNLYAIDSASGSLKWKVNTNGQIRSSPVIDDFSGNQHNSQISGYTN